MTGVMRLTTHAAHTTLAALLLAAAVGTSVTHDAAIVTQHSKPVNIPTWQKHHQAQFPDCVNALPNVTPRTVIAVRLDGTTVRVGFDEAQERAHNTNTADDLWVIGVCP